MMDATLQSDYIKLLTATYNYSSSRRAKQGANTAALLRSALKTEKTRHPLMLDATNDQVPLGIAPRVSKAKG